jgi:BMFP domain-containing protein YqiC
MDLAKVCRRLADYHGMLDLPERVREAVDLQRQQRVALAQAADAIERLRARVAELEAARDTPPASTIQVEAAFRPGAEPTTEK